MPIKTEIWRVDKGLEKVSFSKMETEKKLEAILDQDITIIDPDLMIIGRQVLTSFGKYVDLLAIDSEGHLAIIELKKDKTPRDVVAQTLDYASWVQTLTYDDVIRIFAEYDTARDFETAFTERFVGNPPESLNEDHRLLIVASELDNSSERIVNYLFSNYGVPINAVYFQYFKDGQGEYLSRTWLIDPVKAEVQSSKVPRAGGKEIWNGTDYYVSFGEGPRRNWEDAVKYGFVSAGGRKWYSNTLSLLHPGARIFVNIPGTGYVGVGIVKEESVRVNKFFIDLDGIQTPILKAPHQSPEMGDNADDPDLSEYFVKVDWIKTISIKNAVWEKGMFANQNSACKLRNKFTVERLTEVFGLENINPEVPEQETIEFPVQIRAQHKGETFYAELLNIKGSVRFEKKYYSTPTSAAKVIVIDWKEVNGWDFWRFLNPKSGEWEKIGKLR
jgi:hypothetical protein